MDFPMTFHTNLFCSFRFVCCAYSTKDELRLGSFENLERNWHLDSSKAPFVAFMIPCQCLV